MLKRLALLGLLTFVGPAWAGFMAGPAPVRPSDVSIPVSTTPVGAVAADAFFGWTNPADSAGNDTQWTSPTASIRYLYPTNSKYPIATTTGSWRDVEVTTWARWGCVLVRWSGTTAIYFEHQGNSVNGSVTIGVITGINPGGVQFDTPCPDGSLTALAGNSNLVGTVPGYSKTDTAGDTFTFGCAGWECYVKFNGTEFLRTDPDVRLSMEVGSVAISTASTSYGFRDVSVVWQPLTTIYSTPAASIYDTRDFGFRAVETTGTISGGSTSLAVASSAGFVVGDKVIVECGGESGACARNTEGVGGTWPAAHYANDAAMDAAVPCTANSYAYLEDSGKVRQCNTTGSAWYSWDPYLYYTNTMVPRALSATITAVSGNTLTLDTAASATTTNANVYRDSTPALTMFGYAIGDSVLTPIGTYRFPENTVLQGENTLYLRSGTSYDTGMNFEGVGLNKSSPQYTFFAPDGSPGITVIWGYQADYVTVDGIYIRNNAGLERYGLTWTANGLTGRGYPYGNMFVLADYSRMIDSGALDSFGATATSYCNRCELIGSYARITEPQQQYVVWQIQQADSFEGSITNGEVDSDWMIAGFEIFRSDGTDVIRPVGRNAGFASNSSGGDWLIDAPYFLIEQNSQYSEASWSHDNPIMNINSNIQPPSPSMDEGGEIRNPTIINNYINVSNNLMTAININTYNPNIRITGTYPSCLEPNGLISYPATNRIGGTAINSSGEGTTISGIRADGTNSNPFWGDVALTVNTGQSITDSVVDDVVGIGTETNVITNSAYEALCPRRRRPANDNRRGVRVASRRRLLAA